MAAAACACSRVHWALACPALSGTLGQRCAVLCCAGYPPPCRKSRQSGQHVQRSLACQRSVLLRCSMHQTQRTSNAHSAPKSLAQHTSRPQQTRCCRKQVGRTRACVHVCVCVHASDAAQFGLRVCWEHAWATCRAQPVPKLNPKPCLLSPADLFEPRKDAPEDLPRREEAVYLYGVDIMSTKDCLQYFDDYGPTLVEWINDSSCECFCFFGGGRGEGSKEVDGFRVWGGGRLGFLGLVRVRVGSWGVRLDRLAFMTKRHQRLQLWVVGPYEGCGAELVWGLVGAQLGAARSLQQVCVLAYRRLLNPAAALCVSVCAPHACVSPRRLRGVCGRGDGAAGHCRDRPPVGSRGAVIST